MKVFELKIKMNMFSQYLHKLITSTILISSQQIFMFILISSTKLKSILISLSPKNVCSFLIFFTSNLIYTRKFCDENQTKHIFLVFTQRYYTILIFSQQVFMFILVSFTKHNISVDFDFSFSKKCIFVFDNFYFQFTNNNIVIIYINY